jgi:peptidoglycan/LPS O-acetylase OafA/YrhL
VSGLDTLRFVTAMWVAFSHGARFPIAQLLQPTGVINKMLYALVNTTFNGTAAVSVFFVISGLLIHGGNVGKSRVNMLSFWVRRGVRIGIRSSSC